jgi:hypothetical protein
MSVAVTGLKAKAGARGGVDGGPTPAAHKGCSGVQQVRRTPPTIAGIGGHPCTSPTKWRWCRSMGYTGRDR